MLGFLFLATAVGIGLGTKVMPILFQFIETRKYEQTDYFQQTQRSLQEIKADKGLFGEFNIYRQLAKLEGYKKFLFNCYVYKDNGDLTEIDMLCLHRSGLYVIESKNYSGWIFGTETHKNWTQTLPAGRSGGFKKIPFFNPIIQNKVHLKWLSYYLNDETPPLHSFIVFSDDCTLKEINLTSYQHQVIQQRNLLSAVKRTEQEADILLSPAKIDRLYKSLRPLTRRNQKIKRQHIEQVQQKRQAAKSAKKTVSKTNETNPTSPFAATPRTRLAEPTAGVMTVPNAAVPVKTAGISTSLEQENQSGLEKQQNQITEQALPSSANEEAQLLREIQEALAKSETATVNSIESLSQIGTQPEQQTTEPVQKQAILQEVSDLRCPRCQNPLVLRTATKGSHRGQQFWGCSAFPKCRYLKNLAG